MGTNVINDNNGKIFIPYESLEDYIHCSICLSVIRGAVLTPCGHRYCSRCITEWVGQKHTCPCCNSQLQATQFYFDVQFDSLIEQVLLQRDKAEETYFENMFQTSVENTSKSPFEEILKKHMKSSLLSHQRYYDKLKEDYRRKLELIDRGSSLYFIGSNSESTDELKAKLKSNLEESEKLIADAFDRYLTENVPSFEILPVNVSIYLADKDVRILDVIIKPSESLLEIKPKIEAAMQERCDDILNWTDDTGVRLLFDPLAKNSHYNLCEVLNNIHNRDDVHSLTWDSRPIFQFNMKPGSEIVLQGVFKSQSDLPKRCYVNIFKELGPQTVDYFTCNNCNVKWICKSCIQCCHTGHSVSPFAMDHVPTWACCYCPKKKLCKIQDK
ncbi:polycomb group RING finger protein 6-like isoform X2 [Physella acuta]|nr:polycomb group RING finger protein 6-like isoform X2 [Physella acuta]XP_059170982.1 polycomb group RING finger protein 6-like isoform X2 [Physella acuta]